MHYVTHLSYRRVYQDLTVRFGSGQVVRFYDVPRLEVVKDGGRKSLSLMKTYMLSIACERRRRVLAKGRLDR